MERTCIGKVSATVNKPSTCFEFEFWLCPSEHIKLSEFVVVENKDNSITCGQILDIAHITEGRNHIENYISSNLGETDREPVALQVGVTYATVKIIGNSSGISMPPVDGAAVYRATPEEVQLALGQDYIDDDDRIAVSVIEVGEDLIPLYCSKKHLLGPEGAHMNITGMSGLATKTSFSMFMLKNIQETYKDDVAIIVMNVKSADLLHLDEPNPELTEEDFRAYNTVGIEPEPFHNVKYFYPFCKKKENKYARTAVDQQTLEEQIENKRAFNYVYTYTEDRGKLDCLFSDINDSQATLESVITHISDESNEFSKINSWAEMVQLADKHIESGIKNNTKIQPVTWQRFLRLVKNNVLKDDIFVNVMSNSKEQRHRHLSTEILNIRGGDVFVIDIAKLSSRLQQFVFGDVVRSIQALTLKTEDYEDGDRNGEKPLPKKIIIFVDELNKYAPSDAERDAPLLNYLKDLSERGRSDGIVLFSAEQQKSAVNRSVKGNCSVSVYGRTTAAEASTKDYSYLPAAYRDMLCNLGKGELLIEHSVFPTPIKIKFPRPCYKQ